MQAFDASSMIYAWDNYPIDQFPGLWGWIADQIESKALVMSVVAFGEVNDKTPDCGQWLKEKNLKLLDVDDSIMREGKRIKGLLGIVDDNYHPKGVGENDILIIATARLHDAELVSDEERQTNLPKITAKRKIPAVCAMASVMVSCINFIEYIKGSGAIFG